MKNVNELIKLTQSKIAEEAVETVNARDLHEFLGVQTAFKDWIARRIQDFGFVEELDFCSNLSESSGGRPSKEYFLTLDMAKELSMVERNEKGKLARQYFIECEKQLRQPPQLNDPGFLRDTLLTYTERVIELEAQVEEQKPDVEALHRISTADGSFCFRDAAKMLQIRPIDLNKFLVSNGWIFRQGQSGPWLAYQSKITSGLLEHKVTTIDRSDGTERVVTQCRVTSKGLTKLGKLIPVAVQAA